ncbi:MAG: Lipopolysaccharide export system ATP-binding protein LptB [Chlamydiales bacterium]|nr:Lipopolysaccharide export system ATP-binding protein LptB [Chlamydiales bacterium]MCH9619397.1 Lipopolysaccharide export system ATP-binding protein LptB [Chlamydiales bacterium]MCH9622201.1 Lipopolysaccharide export system ATP-binding protein LptB [Chlamydiales bacterium]
MELLNIKELKKRYGKRTVVDGLTLTLGEGEIVGLLGPNGAGKTTAFYMMMGLIRPDEGSVILRDEEITHLPIDQRAKLGMGYLAQEPSVFRNLTVADNILCILETLPLTKQERLTRLKELLSELNLEKLADKKAASLSGGERRRLEITRALVTNPTLLLLDEPFANIDPIAIHEVKQLIRLLSKKNITTLITDHNAREIFSVATRCYLMRDGKIFLSGSKEELICHPEAKEFYLGNHFQA